MADKDNIEVKSPIIMKVDAPPDENNSSNSSTDEKTVLYEKKLFNENVQPRNSCIPKPVTSKLPVLAKPKFGGGNPFAMKPSVISSPKLNFGNGLFPDNSSKSILRPSKLLANSSSSSDSVKKPFALNPSQFNPFLKVDQSDDSESDDKTEKKPESHSSKSDNVTTTTSEAPKFVPLSGSTNSSSSATTSSNSNFSTSTPTFVFGQNLHERVVGELAAGNGIDTSTSSMASSSCSSNGTSETPLFSSAAAVVCDKSSESTSASGEVKSLSEAAREYEESRAQKRKYEEVAVITGEENEENIMQIGCKLFAFDQITRNWQERGRGNLRLNDIVVNNSEEANGDDKSSYTQSRLVVRSTGSLRVVLNTKIWAGMSVEMASSKSLRLTAMDSSGVVKVFLIMANVKEIEKLYILTKHRVDSEIKRLSTQNQTTVTTNNDDSATKRKATDSD